jgi:hypothetical protein
MNTDNKDEQFCENLYSGNSCHRVLSFGTADKENDIGICVLYTFDYQI